MTTYTNQTAPTQFIEASGIRFAYRRFGKPGGVSLIFNMHFMGTMDYWDPALTDGFAQDREVILFNNAGVSSSSGEVPASIEEMARHAAAFVDALGIKTLDGLGFARARQASTPVCRRSPRSSAVPRARGRPSERTLQ